MSGSRLFAGYTTLEGWAEVIAPTKPVYATRLMEPTAWSGNGGPVVHNLAVVVAQPDEQGIVHYCYIPAATLTMLFGEPFDSKADLRQRCHADVWRFVRDWLHEQGLSVREATFAMPKDYRRFHGRAGFLTFDQATLRYYRTDQAPNPVPMD